MTNKGIKTTIIGVIAILGLAYKIFLEGGLSVEDFFILTMGIGFIASKDYNGSHTKDPDVPPTEEPPPGGKSLFKKLFK